MIAVSSLESTHDRRWGFGLAVATHVTLFALGSFAWQHRAEYGMEASQGAVDVELIAAPERTTAVYSPASSMSTPARVPDVSDVVQPAKISLPQSVTPALPMAITPAAPLTQTVGDGSSPVPGTEATTWHRTGGSEALSKPGYQRNPPPAYPAEARRLKQEGRVLLTVAVTAEGRVGTVELKQSSGFPLLDDAAIKGVQRWQFRPASVGGLRVATDVEIPIRFQLK